jgi:hypothetical protein
MTALASLRLWKISRSSNSSRSLELKLSQKLFSQRLPGSMWAVFAPMADPFPHRVSNELRPIVGPDVGRHSSEDELVREDVDDVGRVELPVDADH